MIYDPRRRNHNVVPNIGIRLRSDAAYYPRREPSAKRFGNLETHKQCLQTGFKQHNHETTLNSFVTQRASRVQCLHTLASKAFSLFVITGCASKWCLSDIVLDSRKSCVMYPKGGETYRSQDLFYKILMEHTHTHTHTSIYIYISDFNNMLEMHITN
jgi:hypothetical protein